MFLDCCKMWFPMVVVTRNNSYCTKRMCLPGADLWGQCRGDDLRLSNDWYSRHQSATPFLGGAPPPKKNPGSAPERVFKVKGLSKCSKF